MATSLHNIFMTKRQKIKGYVTVAEAAKYLKRSHSTVVRYCQNKMLKSISLGDNKPWLIEDKALRAFVCPSKRKVNQ